MIPVLIMIISFLLDGILTNFLPYMVGDLSFFTPLLTLVSIFLVYPFYIKKEKNYYISVIILGFCYDLFYTNLLFFHAIIFGMIVFGIHYLYKNLEVTAVRLIFYIILLISFYESMVAFLFYILNLVPITLPKLGYKIAHSLVLNLIFAEIIYGLIHLLPKKYHKVNIN